MKASPLLLTSYSLLHAHPTKKPPLWAAFAGFWYTLSYSGLIFANATARVLPLRSTIITNTTSNSPSKGLLGVTRARIAF